MRERESSANVPSPPSFEEWVEYCFTYGYTDFCNPSERHRESCIKQLYFHPLVLAEYLTWLFENPAYIADQYSNDLIADGARYILGRPTEYLLFARDKAVPLELQARCVRAVGTLYTDLFDRVCGNRGKDPHLNLLRTSKIDRVMYEIWDMDMLEGILIFPKNEPHLVEPCISILETVLTKCRTSACILSALRGIGEIDDYPERSGGDPTITPRLRRLVDRYIERRITPEWLQDFVATVREGGVPWLMP